MKSLILYRTRLFYTLLILSIFCSNAYSAKVSDVLPTKKQEIDTNYIDFLRSLAKEKQSKDSIEVSLSLYNQALIAAGVLKDSNRIYSIYQQMAQLHGIYLQFNKSIEFKTKALRISESIGDPRLIADAKMNIGIEYYTQKNYLEAIAQFDSSIFYCQKANNQVLNSTLTYLIAMSHLKLKNLDKSSQYFNKAYEEIIQSNNSKRLADCYLGMSELNLYKGNLDTASDLLSAAIYLLDSLEPEAGRMQYGFKLAKIYLLKGDVKNAEKFCAYSLKLLNKPKSSKYQLAEVLLVMSEVYEAKKDYSKALIYRKQYELVSDSANNVANQDKFNKLMMGVQMDKKNQEIQLLNLDKKTQFMWKNLLLGGILFLFILVGLILWNLRLQKMSYRKTNELLTNILPKDIAKEIIETGVSKAQKFEQVSVMFTDFKDFTKISEQLSAEELVNELNACFSAFDAIIEKYKIEKIKTIGDAYMAVSGLPISSPSHASDMALAAIEIRDFMIHRKSIIGSKTFEIRIGINSGEVIAGIVGLKKYTYDIWGDTVNIAARLEQNSEKGRINISESTYELLQTKFECIYRGKIEAKNKGFINMYFLNKTIEPSNYSGETA